MFMGLSPKHASTVPLVLNLDTGAITPQFHIVFDDWFATVSSSPESLPPLDSPTWQQLFGDSTYQYVFDEHSADQPPSSADSPAPREPAVRSAYDHRLPPTPLSVPPPPVDGSSPHTVELPATSTSPPQPQKEPPLSPPLRQREASPPVPVSVPEERSMPPPPPPASPLQREQPSTKAPPQEQPPSTMPPSPPQADQPPAPILRHSTHTCNAPDHHGYNGSQGSGYLAHNSGPSLPLCSHCRDSLLLPTV